MGGVPSVIELSDEGIQKEVSAVCSIWEVEQEVDDRTLAVMLKGQELRPQGAEQDGQKQGSGRGREVFLRTRHLQSLASMAPR